jgi:pimeloyl-ACP methyl ester carboxylesterase
MPRLTANGIEIEYEALGDPAGAPLLLIMGLGAQLIAWDDGFCAALVERGFHAVRYDNRDSGLSTRMESLGAPDFGAALRGESDPPYTLDDMADDAVGVLDALGIRSAHIVGASMGCFIAQLVAINHPERALSLTSIMSDPGGEDRIWAEPGVLELLIKKPGPTREERIDEGVHARQVFAGEGNPFDAAAERANVTRAYDRSYYPAGYVRQLIAVFVAGSRVADLAKVRVPTLVVHGVDDPLVPLENGRRVAAAVPGARLLELEGMGHNLPERYWPVVADAIAETARSAASQAAR